MITSSYYRSFNEIIPTDSPKFGKFLCSIINENNYVGKDLFSRRPHSFENSAISIALSKVDLFQRYKNNVAII